jgi:hypothetical protein
MLSRSGFELNEIWHRQAQLVEDDARTQNLRRRLNSGDEDARRPLVSALRRVGDHDEADKLHLYHHAKAFTEASSRLHETEKADDRKGRKKAESSVREARDNLRAHASDALRDRGFDLSKLPSASERYRAIADHAAKHLPKQEDWRKEHALLRHFHGAKALMAGHARFHEGGTFESRAAKHSYIRSVMTRNPNTLLGFGTSHSGPWANVHLSSQTRKPFEHEGGRVYNTPSDRATIWRNGAEYLKQHPSPAPGGSS